MWNWARFLANISERECRSKQARSFELHAGLNCSIVAFARPIERAASLAIQAPSSNRWHRFNRAIKTDSDHFALSTTVADFDRSHRERTEQPGQTFGPMVTAGSDGWINECRQGHRWGFVVRSGYRVVRCERERRGGLWPVDFTSDARRLETAYQCWERDQYVD